VYKYKFLSLTLFLALAGAVPLQAATESKELPKNLQSMSTAPEAAPANSSQTDPENDSLANEASKDFSNGGKSLGRGFVKGAKVTGNAFKTAGTTMGRGFKRAGIAIRDYFAGKPEVEERDLNSEAETEAAPSAPRDSSSEELDAVGNDLPKKAESKRLSQENSKQDSSVN
jgi:hypothetical protein